VRDQPVLPKDSEPTLSPARGATWVIVQIILLGLILLLPTQIDGLPTVPASLSMIALVVGGVIALAGLTIVILSALTLGPNLTIFPAPRPEGRLIQTGLYSLVRHPIYCGVILVALGWSVARAGLLSLVMTGALVVFFDRKAAREEQWLVDKFPEYQEYRRRVRKLIPWLY
jgi:protein-S-isoprenylcysteine O-methyltransferase Ste14